MCCVLWRLLEIGRKPGDRLRGGWEGGGLLEIGRNQGCRLREEGRCGVGVGWCDGVPCCGAVSPPGAVAVLFPSWGGFGRSGL